MKITHSGYDAVTEIEFNHARFGRLPSEPEPGYGGNVKLPGYEPDEIKRLARKIRERVRARLDAKARPA